MPRNVTGGSKHRSQSNSESSKARNNRCLVDDLLWDYENQEKTDGIYVGRVLRRMGCGRMEVFYLNDKGHDTQQIVPMRGGLRGKGKKDVWIDIDSLVMIVDTGLSGATHEIIAVFSDAQVHKLKKLKPDLDPRLLLKGGAEKMEDTKDGFEFEKHEEVNEEVDIDDI